MLRCPQRSMFRSGTCVVEIAARARHSSRDPRSPAFYESADRASAGERLQRHLRGNDRIVIAPAAVLALEIARLGEVAEDGDGQARRDANFVGQLLHCRAEILCALEQHVPVVREKGPRRIWSLPSGTGDKHIERHAGARKALEASEVIAADCVAGRARRAGRKQHTADAVNDRDVVTEDG